MVFSASAILRLCHKGRYTSFSFPLPDQYSETLQDDTIWPLFLQHVETLMSKDHYEIYH